MSFPGLIWRVFLKFSFNETILFDLSKQMISHKSAQDIIGQAQYPHLLPACFDIYLSRWAPVVTCELICELTCELPCELPREVTRELPCELTCELTWSYLPFV